MRSIVTFTLAASLGNAQAPPARVSSPPVQLAGVVVSGTGPDARPVRRARVTLGGGTSGQLVVDTDIQGAYRFDRVPSGDHTLTVEKPGFVTLETAASPNATLTLDRAGAIEGTVSDSAGDPIWNVEVSLHRLGADWRPERVTRSRTDDLGRYRFHSLAAGEYYVEAVTDATFLASLLLLPREQRPPTMRTFYPAASTLEEAKPVQVSLGRDTQGVDLTVMWPTAQPAIQVTAMARWPKGSTATIAGRVLDAASGKPVRNARLILTAPGAGGSLTRSDRLGQFSFGELQARRYTLKAEADRFVSLEFGQQQPGDSGMDIQLRDGEDFTAEIRLPRAGAVEGVVLDEFGDPAANVPVRLARRQYLAGRARLLPAGNRVAAGAQRTFTTVGPGAMTVIVDDVHAPLTDDRGRYRIPALPPGEYFVEALPGAYAGANDVGGFAPTYDPGTSDGTAAVPIAVAVGTDTTASFALVPARTFGVSGMMVNPEGKPVEGGSVWLTAPDSLRRPDFNLARATTGPDGRFRLRNVPQGPYTMQGLGPASSPDIWDDPQGKFFGWLPLTLGDADVEDVVIGIADGRKLRGTVVLEDASVAPPTRDEARMTSIPVDFDSAPLVDERPASITRADLTFELSRLWGVRRLLVTVTSPAWTLKQIRLNGFDVTDAPVDLRTRDVDGVEVVLSSKVCRVTGKVEGDKGPITGYAVILFASDPTKWIDRSRYVVLTRSTQQGWFDVRGLPPEDYLAIALPGIAGNEWQDPEFLQQLRGQATPFTLAEGESRTLELRLKKHP